MFDEPTPALVCWFAKASFDVATWGGVGVGPPRRCHHFASSLRCRRWATTSTARNWDPNLAMMICSPSQARRLA